MNKCLICDCSRIIYYQLPQKPPLLCPYCGRDTSGYTPMKEDDPRVIRHQKENETGHQTGDAQPDDLSKEHQKEQADHSPEKEVDKKSEPEEIGRKKRRYCLVSLDRKLKISIPETGGVIGRTAIGAEELAHNDRISREHIRVTPSKRLPGVTIEDISANGTSLNGERMLKHKESFAALKTEIMLFNEVFILEEDNE